MYVQELVEEIVEKEFRGLCLSCAHAGECHYQKGNSKSIIQCELYDTDEELEQLPYPPKGLCLSCDNAATCNLRGRATGVWHCNEYE